jgi:hypothetical protein
MLPDTPQTSPMRGGGGGESSGDTSDPGDPAARLATAAAGSEPRPDDAGQASGPPGDVDNGHSPGPIVAMASDSVGWLPGPEKAARPEEVWVGVAAEDSVVRVGRDGTWQADWV